MSEVEKISDRIDTSNQRIGNASSLGSPITPTETFPPTVSASDEGSFNASSFQKSNPTDPAEGAEGNILVIKTNSDLKNLDTAEDKISVEIETDNDIARISASAETNPTVRSDIQVGAEVTIRLSDNVEIVFAVDRIDRQPNGSIIVTGLFTDDSRVLLTLENPAEDPVVDLEVVKPLGETGELVVNVNDIGSTDPSISIEYESKL